MTSPTSAVRVIALLLLAVFLPCPAVLAAPTSGGPNILFIGIDDLNDWIGCLGGHPQAKTPNMDRLAARGTLFTNAHTQAPLCNPSRTSIMTGLRPSTTGVYSLTPGPRDVPMLKSHITLPQALRSAGYFTFCCGKIYHDGAFKPKDRAAEFDEWVQAPGMPKPKKKFVHTPDDIPAMDWGIFPEDDHDQADWKIADAAIRRLQDLPKDKPFFIACGFRLPHVPCYASQKWFDLYPLETLQLPEVNEHDRHDVPFFAWYLHWKLPEPRLSWLKKSGEWKPLVRAYLASTTFMDSQVGRVLDALDASGQADNTVIVLWSDHGWHLGEKDITGKNSLWERSTHVPLIISAPRMPRGQKCAQPAELLDMYPTLLELAGLPPRKDLEGHSLVPQLRDPAAKREFPAITTCNAGNHAVRTDRYRFIQYADGSRELYDLQSDPHEWTNLATDPKHAGAVAALAKHLPAASAPAPEGSKARLLEFKNGKWYWEHQEIDPKMLED